MSHIVSIKTEVRDAEAVKAACKRLGLDEPFHAKAKFYMGDEVTGWCIKLPGWLYLAVADLTTGQVKFDNYEGSWGDQKHLDAFVQAYAVEKATIEAKKRGHTVYEQPLADGSIKLVIQVGGAA